jgi:hypothetical protein
MEVQISEKINTIADSLQFLQETCRKIIKGEEDIEKELQTIEQILGERVEDLRKLARGKY